MKPFEVYRAWGERRGRGEGLLYRSKPKVVYSEKGLSGNKAFTKADSTGVLVPCREPHTLACLLLAKADLNLHVKIWAEGVAEELFLMREFQVDFDFLPAWVWKAVLNQSEKILKAKGTENEGG